MSDTSPSLPTDSTTRLIDQPSSVIDPVAVRRLLQDVLYGSSTTTLEDVIKLTVKAVARLSHDVLFGSSTTTLEDVIKLTVKAVRQGMSGRCLGDHCLLLRDVTANIVDCRLTDFEEDGKKYSNACLACTRYPKRFELIASCGLIDVCCETIMSPTSCSSLADQAAETLARLAEWTRPDTGTLARIVTAYVHYAAVWCCRSQIIHFEQLARLLWSVQEDVAIGALLEAATALMTNSAWLVRYTALDMLAWVINERRALMVDGVTALHWKSVAAAYAPLAARAIGDEHKWIRMRAANMMRSMLLYCPTVITPDCFSAAITGGLQHIRQDPATRHPLLAYLAAQAPTGVLEGVYEVAVRRLRETRDLGSSQEAQCAAFDVVFLAARYAGDSSKASFVEEFDKFLKRNSLLKSNEERFECMACLDKKASVVAKRGCTKLNCGACACTKAHFCSSCLARVFLASANPLKITCPNCRRAVCVDDYRLLEEKSD